MGEPAVPRPPADRPRSLVRLWRGLRSALLIPVFLVGHWWRPGHRALLNPKRFERGWTIILPGIVGHSTLNETLARGLRDAGLDTAIEVLDWTTGWWLLFVYHLRGERRNRRQADAIARRIVEYQDRHPGRPVHLIGHSGGGGLALWILEALPPERRVATAVLLGTTVRRDYDLALPLSRTERGLWNFHSLLDVLFNGAGTLVLGTTDGCHCVSAGFGGFTQDSSRAGQRPGRPRLQQIGYHWSMARQFWLGGHFGLTNEVFAAERIAPILTGPMGTPEQ